MWPHFGHLERMLQGLFGAVSSERKNEQAALELSAKIHGSCVQESVSSGGNCLDLVKIGSFSGTSV